MAHVMLIGETWFIHSIHQKGFDSFTTSEYQEGGVEFCTALFDKGHRVTRIAAHQIPDKVPQSIDGYEDVDLVVISDVGANSFLLTPETFNHSVASPDRLAVLADWVRAGGSLLMVGGYMSFAGIDGRARYQSSALASVLPVQVGVTDDRVEMPQGIGPIVNQDHPVVDGLGSQWPNLLGYNRFTPHDQAAVLATCGSDPLLVVADVEQGRTAAFASDLAPHWAPSGFLTWEGYPLLWDQLVRWLTGDRS